MIHENKSSFITISHFWNIMKLVGKENKFKCKKRWTAVREIFNQKKNYECLWKVHSQESV